jgi:hypothetical protein
MKKIIREITWLNFCDHGYGCGYVTLPKTHPCYGKHYDDIDVQVHGGLTYGRKVTQKDIDSNTWPELTQEDLGKWMVGFNTAHLGDNSIDQDENYVIQETESLYQQLLTMK